MELSTTTKNQIAEEFNNFKGQLYAGKTLEERKTLDQFFTPAELVIKMIEKLDCESIEDKTILDPTCGSGNILMGCLIAGARPENLYGNDYDKTMVELCKNRMYNYCVNNNIAIDTTTLNINIHQGNALQKRCISDFSEEYNAGYNVKYINDTKYAQTEESWEVEEAKAEARIAKAIEKARKKASKC